MSPEKHSTYDDERLIGILGNVVFNTGSAYVSFDRGCRVDLYAIFSICHHTQCLQRKSAIVV